jgi:hypothetical protein
VIPAVAENHERTDSAVLDTAIKGPCEVRAVQKTLYLGRLFLATSLLGKHSRPRYSPVASPLICGPETHMRPGTEFLRTRKLTSCLKSTYSAETVNRNLAVLGSAEGQKGPKR